MIYEAKYATSEPHDGEHHQLPSNTAVSQENSATTVSLFPTTATEHSIIPLDFARANAQRLKLRYQTEPASVQVAVTELELTSMSQTRAQVTSQAPHVAAVSQWPNTPRSATIHQIPSLQMDACSACMDKFLQIRLINTPGCGCKYCSSCLNEHFIAGCSDILAFPPKCCGNTLKISDFELVLRQNVIDCYKTAETEFGVKRPLYCAVPRCSAFIPNINVLPNDDIGICPICTITTCTRCKATAEEHDVWEPQGVRVCPGFDTNTQSLLDLSAKKKWKQCPTCYVLVERVDGCNHIMCVCGIEFCYRCGAVFDEEDLCECDEEDYDSDDNDQCDVDEQDEWPDHRTAIDLTGRPTCSHDQTEQIDPGDEEMCHGCLTMTEDIRSCVECYTQLCGVCLAEIHATNNSYAAIANG